MRITKRQLRRIIREEAANQQASWLIIEWNGQEVGMPEDWYRDGDVVTQGIDEDTAGAASDWILGPGTHSPLYMTMEDLFSSVISIGELVDDGYVDGNKAILAFR